MKYTVKDFEDIVKRVAQVSSGEEIMNIFSQSDTLLRLLLFDQLYEAKQFKILYFLLNNLDNSDDLIKLFSKHIGIDFDALVTNESIVELGVLFKGLKNHNELAFNKALLKRLVEITNKDKNVLDDIKLDYYSLIVDNYEDYFNVVAKLGMASDVYGLITEIMINEDISAVVKQNIYDNVLKKKVQFMSYDYLNIMEDNLEVFINVVGLFNEIPLDKVLMIFENDNISTKDENGNIIKDEEGLEEIVDFIEKAIISYKNNDTEIRKFLIRLEAIKGEKNSYLFEALDKSVIYNNVKEEYNLSSNIYNKIFVDILNGEYSIEFQTLMYEFASSPECLDNYDRLCELLYSNALTDKAQRDLAMVLLVALGKKLVKEYDLECDFVYTNDKMQNNLLGSYNMEEKVLYLNRFYIYGFVDYKEGFVSGVDTLFHELKHAKQNQHEMKEDKWDYDTMLQIMDKYLSQEGLFGSYYESNYRNVSYEADARAQAYVDTMKFFKNNPELQDIAKKQLKEDVNEYKLNTRVDTALGLIDGYSTVLDMYVKQFNYYLESVKEIHEDYVARKEELIPDTPIEFMNKYFNEYPSMKLIFYYDEDENKIELYSKEYFLELLEEFYKEPEVNKDAIFCIESLLYDLKLGEYLSDKEYYDRFYGREDEIYTVIDEINSEVTDEIGLPPVRR